MTHTLESCPFFPTAVNSGEQPTDPMTRNRFTLADLVLSSRPAPCCTLLACISEYICIYRCIYL